MLNQVVLVGRLTSDMEVKESEDGKKYCNMSLAIPRSFKNADGVYDTDFVNIKTFDSIAQNTAEYCNKGDIVGIWSQHMQYKEIYCILPLIYM